MASLILKSPFAGPRSGPSAQLPLDGYDFPPMLARRLAAEHGWTVTYTAQVLSEYRRFLHLAVNSGRSVTPSRVVDEAWHEHLTLTRDYWERLCGEVLGRPVHHEPQEDRGSPDPSAYLATLDLYARTFGEAPPPNIWPDPRSGSPVKLPAARRLVGSSRLRFLICLGLFVGGGLLGHGIGVFIGFLLGLGVLLSGVKWQPRPAGSGAGGEDDSAAWSIVGLSFGNSDSGGDGGGSDGGSSCGSSCGSGCGSS